LIHRGNQFSADEHFAEQIKGNDKISVTWNATVEAILGSQMVEKARIKHTDGKLEERPCAGVFAYIGLEPNTEFLPANLQRDDAGYVRTNDDLETSLAGISAIGAVRSGYKGTLTDAMDEARRAARLIKGRLA
jgi:thioredoxin reductase (NADPH)